MAKAIYYAKKGAPKIAAASLSQTHFFWVRPDLPRFFVSSTKNIIKANNFIVKIKICFELWWLFCWISKGFNDIQIYYYSFITPLHNAMKARHVFEKACFGQCVDWNFFARCGHDYLKITNNKIPFKNLTCLGLKMPRCWYLLSYYFMQNSQNNEVFSTSWSCLPLPIYHIFCINHQDRLMQKLK